MTKLNNQINKKNDGLSNNRKRQSAIDDISQLQANVSILNDNINRIIESINKAVDPRLSTVEFLTAAIAELIGVDAVSAKMEEMKKIEDEKNLQKSEEWAAGQRKEIEDGLSNGQLETVSSVSEDCLVSVQICDTKGNVALPKELFVVFNGLNPEAKDILRGKTVGEEETDNAGRQVKITGIYKKYQDLCNPQGY